MIREPLRKGIPVITGQSATCLYGTAREWELKDYDDIHGEPSGHFVILTGYAKKNRQVASSDPLLRESMSPWSCALVEERFCRLADLDQLETNRLATMFRRAITLGDTARIEDRRWLEAFSIAGKHLDPGSLEPPAARLRRPRGGDRRGHGATGTDPRRGHPRDTPAHGPGSHRPRGSATSPSPGADHPSRTAHGSVVPARRLPAS